MYYKSVNPLDIGVCVISFLIYTQKSFSSYFAIPDILALRMSISYNRCKYFVNGGRHGC